MTRALGRRDVPEARRIYAVSKPSYTLDHLLRERYPRFDDALGDLDDALSLVHLFASLPAVQQIKPARTAAALRLVREWQYFIARSRSLRKVFFSVKGVYYQAQVRGATITWLQPWPFSQTVPLDVDYRVMLTFLDFYDTLLQFVLFKLYHSIGLAYPPRVRADVDGLGGHLSTVDAATALVTGPAAGGAAGAMEAAAVIDAPPADDMTARRRASLKQKIADIIKAEAATPVAVVADAGDGAGAVTSAKRARPGPVMYASMYDFVDVEDAGGVGAEAAAASSAAAFGDIAAFSANSAEARALLERNSALQKLTRLFSGCVFFLNREVPRDVCEFVVCAFRGRVGWDGPGTPYSAASPCITHHIVDRPMGHAPALAPGTTADATNAPASAPDPRFNVVNGRAYVQPQWLADCVNARLLLPTAKYSPGAVLPPHLSPFVDDSAEGYVPAYRTELDRLRAAAAASGRLADTLDKSAEAAAALGQARPLAHRKPDDDNAEVDDLDADALKDDTENDEDDGDTLPGCEDDEALDEDDVEDALATMESPMPAVKRARVTAPIRGGEAAEEERRALAASMLSRTKRKTYEIVLAAQGHRMGRTDTLRAKAAAAASRGDRGVGSAPGGALAAKFAAAATASMNPAANAATKVASKRAVAKPVLIKPVAAKTAGKFAGGK